MDIHRMSEGRKTDGLWISSNPLGIYYLGCYEYIRVFHQTILSNARVRRMIYVSRSLSHSLCSRKKSADVKRLLRYSGHVERTNINGGHRRPFSPSLLPIANVIRPPLIGSPPRDGYRYSRHERAAPLRRRVKFRQRNVRRESGCARIARFRIRST